MSEERQRLRPWLEERINSGKVPGLCWRDQEKKEFRVSWKHAGKPDFDVEKDAMLFKLWAEHTGKYRPGESADPSTWKTRFRCALHKMPDVEEVRIPHSLDEKEPYRVFRFKDKEGGSPKSPKSDKTRSERRHCPYPRSNSEPMIIRPPADVDETGYDFKNYVTSFGGYGNRQQDSPLNDSSDSSLEDCDLDSITPTIPPYLYEPMLSGDETTCGNQVNQFFSYSNGHGFYNSEFTAGSGFVNTRREVIEAVFPANGHVASNSMLGDNGQALLQHFLAANNYNPSGLMKLWWGGVVIPDEPPASSSTSTHLNMDNGLIVPSGIELDDLGRTVTIPCMDDMSRSSFSRASKSPSDNYFTTHIRVFYGKLEVLYTEARLTESERIIRFFYGSPIAPELLQMDLYSKVYGPPGAKQIKLPEVESTCPETKKVMSYLKRGLLLEVTEDYDILATRLALTRVFYSNGRQPATKLQREKQTKVFDYTGKFIPTLRESRNGNCECPADDVTFYLGKADSSLVSIVVTHTKARTNLHKANTTGQKFLSEPNLNDQLATSLEQDCMY
ncbi:unnamed protein product [Porites evermanni]|uniref:IRF tryptophan pentad repeat domain-containing protein n=1 Tax=Porites evermanni TaxID=104178 RepID=A0ABN8LKG3_9CNID|nr:unnamed protein product [Porites evermanni]